MPARGFEYVWEIDRGDELKGRTLWWWWNFYFRDASKKDEGKQLLLIWATRNCDRLKLDDMLWTCSGGEVRRNGAVEVRGINVGAYYDGTRMHHPLILANGKLSLRRSSSAGSLDFEDSSVRTRYEGDEERGRISAAGDGFEINVRVEPWTRALSEPLWSSRNYS